MAGHGNEMTLVIHFCMLSVFMLSKPYPEAFPIKASNELGAELVSEALSRTATGFAAAAAKRSCNPSLCPRFCGSNPRRFLSVERDWSVTRARLLLEIGRAEISREH